MTSSSIFAFPGNIDFAADDQVIVCESKFTVGESRTISHANDDIRGWSPIQFLTPTDRA